MSSHSPSPERTLNRVVRAGVTVANAARRRRTRRRARKSSPPPPPPLPPSPLPPSPLPPSPLPPSPLPPSPLPPSTHSSNTLSDSQSRRRNDLRQTLLSFPEHDPSTITALLNHYHGDRDRVIEKLSEARIHAIPPKTKPITTKSPQSKHLPFLQEDRHTQHLAPPPQSPPPLTLATHPHHQRRPSRRFSREAAAPLWAAAVRTTTNSDISSVASTVNGTVNAHPQTPRIAGSKRPRRSPMTSDTTDASVSSWPDFNPALYTPPSHPTELKPSAQHTISAIDDVARFQDPAALLLSTPPIVANNQPENFQLLMRRVGDLEAALSRFVENSETGRAEVGRRLQSAELEMGALERRHETLEHDLEENRKRVSKTEQYLDTMRRDVRYATGGRSSKLFLIVRQGANGVMYYLLAYLVPVFFFLARAVRDAVATLRRRFRDR